LGSQNPTGYEVGRERILSHKSEFPATGICKLTSPPSYEVFGCRAFIDHCCPREKAGVRKPPRKETASRKGVAAAATYRDLRVAGVCRRAVGMTIKDDFEVFSGGNGIIFFAAAVYAKGASSAASAPPAFPR
jgi:hypothetical protein